MQEYCARCGSLRSAEWKTLFFLVSAINGLLARESSAYFKKNYGFQPESLLLSAVLDFLAEKQYIVS